MLCEFSVTQKGESHIKHDLPCQDHSDSFAVPATGEPKYVAAIVADGVGSEEYSDKGSKSAVDVVSKCLKGRLASTESHDHMLDVIEDAFEEALDAALDMADDMQEPFTKFATTLTVAVFDGRTLWYGHAGDDGIVAMRRDGTYGMVTERHEGDLANSVVPFGSRRWQFGEEADVASCVLMTDGILDYCVKDQLEGNRVKLPFLKPLLYAVLETVDEVQTARADWDEFLMASRDEGQADGDTVVRTVFRDLVRDDLSIALLSNPEAVANLPAYSFDLDAWNADSDYYEAAREEGLAELDRVRLEEDSEYRERVRLGKERHPRQGRQLRSSSMEGVAPATDAKHDSAMPVPLGVPAKREAQAREASAPCSLGDQGGGEWPQVLADGACVVVRGIGIIGDAIEDAVQEMFKKT
ncbi:MAG: protein phosphatase 2C domain-containing protein [Coriobacteriales bacterium]|nr:protein phosphatase 2C domain-containing protein [Coriobacteriales bacterium]